MAIKLPASLQQLIDSFQILPGVGPKTAQRMALYLLEKDRLGAERLSNSLMQAMNKLCRCTSCRNYAEEELCPICSDSQRSTESLCVVESPSDVLALEQGVDFSGQYFVLYGHLSPIDGIGPNELGLADLKRKVDSQSIKEVIVATNPTVEGEATAQFIMDMLPSDVVVSRIAHGIPMGGELDLVDGGTLNHALTGRRVMS
ncbi:MAG TPA: recombination protein RecR [Oceanospirillales bacterium]|jgi:recombination protein RecR|nr:recombination protein RecR [Oleispira sp.]HCM06509.1 recombination protein RecR [Oceanospirillales bacterium]|tara:strand:+ start:2554 stop:3156 length:603 start_codon:yes stop_codon:yes gene_type:complete